MLSGYLEYNVSASRDPVRRWCKTCVRGNSEVLDKRGGEHIMGKKKGGGEVIKMYWILKV